MLILTQLDITNIYPNDILTRDEIIEGLTESLIYAIRDADPMRYKLSRKDQPIRFGKVVLGREEPEALLEVARGWNEKIVKSLIDSALPFLSKIKYNSTTGEIEQPIPEDILFSKEAENVGDRFAAVFKQEWDEYGTMITYLDRNVFDCFAFNAILTKEHLSMIEAHPEWYATITLI